MWGVNVQHCALRRKSIVIPGDTLCNDNVIITLAWYSDVTCVITVDGVNDERRGVISVQIPWIKANRWTHHRLKAKFDENNNISVSHLNHQCNWKLPSTIFLTYAPIQWEWWQVVVVVVGAGWSGVGWGGGGVCVYWQQRAVRKH